MAKFFNPFRRDGRSSRPSGEQPKPENAPSHLPVDNPEAKVPTTIQELLALQEIQPNNYGPVAKSESSSGKVQEALSRILELSTSPLEDQQIALALIGRLEGLHQAVVQQLQQDPEASHSQITHWSIDSDRLLHARNMLANVDLG
jgi:hypothetical protein